MIKEAIDRILEISTPKVMDIHGRKFATGGLVEMPSPRSQAGALAIHTLCGLVEFVASKFDVAPKVCAHIGGPEDVYLTSSLFGDFRQRETFIHVHRFDTKGFPFGQFIDVESFVVQMQSRFVQDPTVAQVLKVVGNIKETTVKTLEDDGISQQVTAMAGVARVANVVLPNPVELRPFRTFQEIQQPASLFVLRVRSGDDEELPTVALFEVEDCCWKVEAVKGIKLFLEDNLGKDFPIFA
jgi:hypothetical protein